MQTAMAAPGGAAGGAAACADKPLKSMDATLRARVCVALNKTNALSRDWRGLAGAMDLADAVDISEFAQLIDIAGASNVHSKLRERIEVFKSLQRWIRSEDLRLCGQAV